MVAASIQWFLAIGRYGALCGAMLPSLAQIDSMHSQAYYPVLLQRAPHMPSEVSLISLLASTSAMQLILPRPDTY